MGLERGESSGEVGSLLCTPLVAGGAQDPVPVVFAGLVAGGAVLWGKRFTLSKTCTNRELLKAEFGSKVVFRVGEATDS